MNLSCLRGAGGGIGYVERGYYSAVTVAVLEKTTARWRVVWRRLKKEKKRMFRCGMSGAREVHVPYNPKTYLQNFDDGSVMMVGDDDPDAISRSFSARFAISSAILRRPPPEFVVLKLTA
ncbi:hypothetical protein SDJN02_00099, partial [Cucurbita argyrosperma subsp. argyrosperma]